MNCPICDSDTTLMFFNENLECHYCHKDNSITYHACSNCSFVWKAIGEQFIDGMVLEDGEWDSTFEDFDSFYKNNTVGPFKKGPTTMAELLHTCIRCGKQAFESHSNYYFCPSCGFEWEVE